MQRKYPKVKAMMSNASGLPTLTVENHQCIHSWLSRVSCLSSKKNRHLPGFTLSSLLKGVLKMFFTDWTKMVLKVLYVTGLQVGWPILSCQTGSLFVLVMTLGGSVSVLGVFFMVQHLCKQLIRLYFNCAVHVMRRPWCLDCITQCESEFWIGTKNENCWLMLGCINQICSRGSRLVFCDRQFRGDPLTRPSKSTVGMLASTLWTLGSRIPHRAASKKPHTLVTLRMGNGESPWQASKGRFSIAMLVHQRFV